MTCAVMGCGKAQGPHTLEQRLLRVPMAPAVSSSIGAAALSVALDCFVHFSESLPQEIKRKMDLFHTHWVAVTRVYMPEK